MDLWAAHSPLFIGKPRGKVGIHKYQKYPHFMSFTQRIKEKGVPCGAPWSSTLHGRPPLGGPPKGASLVPKASRSLLGKFPKGAFHKIPKKHFHYSRRHFSVSVRTEK